MGEGRTGGGLAGCSHRCGSAPSAAAAPGRRRRCPVAGRRCSGVEDDRWKVKDGRDVTRRTRQPNWLGSDLPRTRCGGERAAAAREHELGERRADGRHGRGRSTGLKASRASWPFACAVAQHGRTARWRVVGWAYGRAQMGSWARLIARRDNAEWSRHGQVHNGDSCASVRRRMRTATCGARDRGAHGARARARARMLAFIRFSPF
jgi:hypothetical protein